MAIYTRTGDDGTTGLLFGGRVGKESDRISAVGDIDETQAALGVARATTDDDELDGLLVRVQRDLYVAMAEVGTHPSNAEKLTDGQTQLTDALVDALEADIDRFTERFEAPTDFVLPGEHPTAAALDLARTVCRRAERSVVRLRAGHERPVRYLNRLSDLCWTLARWQEGQARVTKEA